MRYANEVVIESLRNDREFLLEYFRETISGLFTGQDLGVHCLMLRDIVNATITFPVLADKMGKNDKGKGLMQMLTKGSNPYAQNLFAIVHEVMEYEGITVTTIKISDKAA